MMTIKTNHIGYYAALTFLAEAWVGETRAVLPNPMAVEIHATCTSRGDHYFPQAQRLALAEAEAYELANPFNA